MSADSTQARILQGILVRESRSLLQYVSEAFPWTTPAEKETLAHVQSMVKEELDGGVALARFLTRLRLGAPYLGAYPMSFTTINFVSLAHLVPLLAEHTGKMIAEVENVLPGIHDPEARALVEKILAAKKRHRETLLQLAAKSTPSAAA